MKSKQLAFDMPKGSPRIFRQRQLTEDSPFPFGKYKKLGLTMQEVPADYLTWFLKQDWSHKWPAVVTYITTTYVNRNPILID